jgi:hypothetical protein
LELRRDLKCLSKEARRRMMNCREDGIVRSRRREEGKERHRDRRKK